MGRLHCVQQHQSAVLPRELFVRAISQNFDVNDQDVYLVSLKREANLKTVLLLYLLLLESLL